MDLILLQQVTNSADQLGSLSDEVLSYFKLLFILGGILVLAVVIIRRFLPRITTLPSRDGVIQVFAQYALEPRKRLYLVKVGEQFFLLGAWEAGISNLGEVQGGELERIETSDVPPQSGRAVNFRKLIQWKKGDIA